MFFSERDLFSIDLYLADTATGKVIRKITDTATDPALRESAVPRVGRRVGPLRRALRRPGDRQGEPVLAIVNVDNGEARTRDRGRRRRRGAQPDLVAGRQPHRVLRPGRRAERPVRLRPRGEHAEAADQRCLRRNRSGLLARRTQIAFATDRFTTKLDMLAYRRAAHRHHRRASPARCATSAASRAPRTSVRSGRATAAACSSSRTARASPTSTGSPSTAATPMQLTNLVTGVSGITALSPAMSAAGGRVIFSAYEDDGYNVYALETETQLAGTAPVELPGECRRAAAANGRGRPGRARCSTNPTASLPPAEPRRSRKRTTSRSCRSISPGSRSIGVGADPFGTYAAGGVSFLFSDMLGNHTVATSAQVTSRFDEFGGSVFYLNKSHRWNWGVGLDQTPYVSRGYQSGHHRRQRTASIGEDEYRVLQTDRSLSGVISYPFSRALRVEVDRRRPPDRPEAGRAFAAPTRRPDRAAARRRRRRSSAIFDDLNLGQASAALVYDTSIFGATSPIRGSRSASSSRRASVRSTSTASSADGRTYLMPMRPFTLRAPRPVVRALRHRRGERPAADAVPRLPGPGARLRSGIVRGGGVRRPARWLVPGVRPPDRQPRRASSTPSCACRCGRSSAARTSTVRCRSRWRSSATPVLPGAADHETRVRHAATEKPVSSFGVAVRANLFGFAVGEIDYVKPLEPRPRLALAVRAASRVLRTMQR